ncbi:MAG: pilus assembly protein PilP [Nitrospira sp.]|nr:pilus assembly protein PilP [Nitrospira sp.]
MGVAVLVSTGLDGADAETLLAQMQVSPMRQDSINKMPATPESSQPPITAADAPSSVIGAPDQAQVLPASSPIESGYDQAGRRDPFAPIIQDFQPGKVDENLPPLQRVSLTELNLIAVVWGTYGYTAMVQTPEGHGYTVRRGTKVGQHNGVVSAVTERGIIVQEQFTDVYGKKQEREFIKLLHPKEGSE